jgi:hypothetical protein
MPDYCGTELGPKEDPGTVANWRMRCTIQKLVAERAEAEDKATQIEVNLAVSDAYLRAARVGRDAEAEYWRQYVEGLKFSPDLEKSIDAACAWHGTQNAPTAKMCGLWQQKR